MKYLQLATPPVISPLQTLAQSESVITPDLVELVPVFDPAQNISSIEPA